MLCILVTYYLLVLHGIKEYMYYTIATLNKSVSSHKRVDNGNVNNIIYIITRIYLFNINTLCANAKKHYK